MSYLYIFLAVTALLGIVYVVEQELAWQRRMADMAREVKERGNDI